MESEREMSSAVTSAAPATNRDGRQEQAIDHIRTALQGLRYGSVIVTVQDGVVVQVDRTEKHRLTAPLSGLHAMHSSVRENNST